MSNSITDFLLSASLYETLEIDDTNLEDLFDILQGDVRISSYCNGCNQERVFASLPVCFVKNESGVFKTIDSKLIKNMWQKDNIEQVHNWNWPKVVNRYNITHAIVEFSCAMNSEHHLYYAITFEDSNIRKIGQYPSVADLEYPQLKDYKSVIENEKIKELKTAIGLYSHGVGAGAYIYLRRIFEYLVNEAIIEAEKVDPEIKKELNGSYMSERIKMLSKYLPDALVDNPQLYPILSKGIHELSENECKTYFPVLKEAIMIILDQKKADFEKKAREDSINKELNKIASEI